MNRFIHKQKFITLFLLFTFIFSSLSSVAQTRRTTTSKPNSQTTVASQPKETKKDCNSGYSGTIKYTKTVTTASTGKFGSHTDMKRVYQANLIIRDDGRQMGSVTASADGVSGSFNFKAQAEASENESFEDVKNTEGDDFCKLTLAGAKDKTHYKCSSVFKRQSDAQGTGESTVFIGLRGRKLQLSLGSLPKLAGKASRSSKSSCSGTCSPDKPIDSSDSSVINNGGERSAATDEGVIEFNPQNFNRLSGSWTRSDATTVETFQWNLSRCAPALEIADVRFEHKRVTNPDQWVGIDPLTGTIDGNIVRIKAKVFNNGGDTAYANVKFSELKSNEQLPDGAVSVAVKPGEFRDVEYEWDTSGFAWNENQKNESQREIKAEIEGGNSETGKIKILPKPVILVHGLWSNAAAWAEYPTYLREAHSFAWQAFAVGADPAHGKMSTGDHPGNYKPTNTIYQNAQELAKQIKFTRESLNAWHVDIVAHSMGGLISRQYINTFMQPVFDGKPEITHLVMLGTPNMGSPCADTVNQVFEDTDNNEMHAMRELKPIIVRAFNTRINDRKGVKFSVLIGVIPVPRTCLAEGVFGDGVVPIESAKYNLTDYAYAPRDHISLTGIEDFKGFVMPRIAIGPKKARTEKNLAWLENKLNDQFASSENNDRYGFNQYFRKVSFGRENNALTAAADETTDANITARQKVVLAPKQTQEIEIPAGEAGGKSAGVLLVAPTGVVATLTDAASGAILGKSEGGTEAVKNPFRMILANKTPTGVMKLKLENFEAQETIVFIAGFTNSGASVNFTVEAGKPTAAGAVPLQAKLTENNAPVLNAKITGKIVGQKTEIMFYDDGKHNDEKAADGIYGAATEKLAKGEYFVEARAEANNQTKMTVAVIQIGENLPIKPATRQGK